MLCNENFILPKSLYVCIIRYHDEEEDPEGGEDEASSNFRTSDHFRMSDIGGQELRRLDDLKLQKGCYFRRTSDGIRTSDMTDIRHGTDVRHEDLRDDPQVQNRCKNSRKSDTIRP